jgi:hypothetical protein
MTDEQIIQLATKHFSYFAEYAATGWIADTEDLLKFALAIHENGYNKGYDEGYEMGFEYRDNFDKGYANKS